MPRTQINFTAAETFIDDVKEQAEQKDISVSEYIREATRQQMQRDLMGEE